MAEPNIDELTGNWVLDPAASEVKIAHRSMWGLVKVKGTLRPIGGSAVVSDSGLVSGSVTVDASSIDTRNKKRDEHLRSADFFDSASHPEMTVSVSSATVHGDHVHLAATLSIRGHTSPLDLDTRVSEANPRRVVLDGTGKVDRKLFGLTWDKFGMMSGPTSVEVKAAFTRP